MTNIMNDKAVNIFLNNKRNAMLKRVKVEKESSKAWRYVLSSLTAVIIIAAVVFFVMPDGLNEPLISESYIPTLELVEVPMIEIPLAPFIAAEPPAPEPTPAPMVGDIIRFGSHDWLVLDVQSDRILIITENIISHRTYHTSFANITWETSEVRQYLNNTIFNTFSEADRSRILETNLINNNNPWDWSEWGGHVSTPGGIDTIDRIFLLSIDEVLTFFGDSGMIAQGALMSPNEREDNQPEWPGYGIFAEGIHDQYSNKRIARDSADSAVLWWLRSPGANPYFAAVVYGYGSIQISGFRISYPYWSGLGIRPALWLSLH